MTAPTYEIPETLSGLLASLIDDNPEAQSRELALMAVAAAEANVLHDYMVNKLEADIHAIRRRRVRETEQASGLRARTKPTVGELRSRAAELLQDFQDQIRIDWTAELRSATFAVGDGTNVAWGKATVEQHEARIDMLARNARGNLDGIRRHEAAIRDLTGAGVRCLNEMIQTMAAAA